MMPAIAGIVSTVVTGIRGLSADAFALAANSTIASMPINTIENFNFGIA